jgi:hypothetical protein
VKCQVRLMDGVNPHTVWTWNAIGKRKGAWASTKDAPEATKGFLLNHLISRTAAAQGRRATCYSNSDPITGQAAWFDLRVSIAKADGAGETEPRFEALGQPGGVCPRPRRNSPMARRRSNAHDQPARKDAEETRPGDRSRHLRRLPCLRGQLQGMEHRRGYSPLSDVDAYGADPSGAWLNRIHTFEMETGGRAGADRAFPQILPALR